MERIALSKALEEQVGDRKVQALLFCTHDLDPSFFEQEVLQGFLGNDLKHNQRTREVQLEYVIRERDIPIDVFFEPKALVATLGAARLGWHRHPVRLRKGLFHPKLVLVLCTDAEGSESLVVCVSSANLTQSSWWRNIECADVIRIDDGQRHGYATGLWDFLTKLKRRSATGVSPALDVIREFLKRQGDYSNTSVGGRLVPQLLPGLDGEQLLNTLLRLGGSRLKGAHLEVLSPFFDGSPEGVVERLAAWRDALEPRSFKVALPGRDGRTTLSEEVYEAVQQMPGVSWASLPSAYVKAADGEDAADRSLHAKVYRLWRGKPDPLEILILGSHNFTSPAHSGVNNWEVSVLFEPPEPHLARLLINETDAPGVFLMYDEDLGEESKDDLRDMPLTLVYDWQGAGSATATWLGTSPETVTLAQVGRTLFQVDLPQRSTVTLDRATTAALADALKVSALLTCRRSDGREGALLCEELNHDLKPDLLEGLELTPAEIFALWSVDVLEDRVRLFADFKAKGAPDEPDLELVDLLPSPSPSMFERFAGVFHAFASLRTRVEAAMAQNNTRRAGRTMYSEQFDSPLNALRVMRESNDLDLPLAYVTWGCVRLLDRDLASKYPELVSEFTESRARLTKMLDFEATLRQRLIESSEDEEMKQFLLWFDAEFAEEGSDA